MNGRPTAESGDDSTESARRMRLADLPLAIVVSAIWLLHRLWLVLPPRATSRSSATSTPAPERLRRPSADEGGDGRLTPSARVDRSVEIDGLGRAMPATVAAPARVGTCADAAGDGERRHAERQAADVG